MGVRVVVFLSLRDSMKKPQKVKPSGLSSDLRKAHNELHDFVMSLQPLSGHSVQIDKTGKGFFTRAAGSGLLDKAKDSTPRWL